MRSRNQTTFDLIFLTTAMIWSSVGFADMTVSEFVGGQQNIVGFSVMSSEPGGTATIQEQNLCPSSYMGGQLLGESEFFESLLSAKEVNGQIYINYPAIPPTGSFSLTGSPIDVPFNINGPFPPQGPLVTISELHSPAVYIYGMECTYAVCDGGAGCEWNAPFYWVALNLGPASACSPVLSLSLAKSSVAPSKVSLPNSTTVTAKLNLGSGSPDCVSGKVVQFSSQPLELTGGHNHSGPRPKGSFNASSCVTDATGSCQVLFSASEVSGIETISATFTATNPISTQTATQTVDIEVPDLINFANFPTVHAIGGVLVNLSGSTSAHPDNHYIKPAVATNLLGLALDLGDVYQARIGINDLSLEKGGLFDIGPTQGLFWNAPHISHRRGTSADVDRCAVSLVPNNPHSQGQDCTSAGMAQIEKQIFSDYCNVHGGVMAHEASLHCEFK